MTLDVSKMCEAKSDQINAIDLVGGARIVKITDVKIFTETDQPIHVILDDDKKRPWKCSKTSVRTLSALYGLDASKWIGKHIEIFCDETVLWAGQPVGGIRQSRAEGIKGPKKLMLTKSRTKKETVVINPLSEEDIKSHYNTQRDEVDIKETPMVTSTITPTNPLFQDARDNAELGTAAMRAWWQTKTKAEQKQLGEILAELQEIAAKADKENQ